MFHLARCSLAVVLLAGPWTAALAADSHSHAGHAEAQIRLDNGKKWQTDWALRRGMETIRSAMLASPSADAVLGARIEEEIDRIARECKLPPAADAQLHLVLAGLIDGAALLKAGDGAGIGRVGEALEAYGRQFDHPGWRPLH